MKPAELPARVLAALIDYAICFGITSLALRSGVPIGWGFAVSLLLGAVYFGTGNSRLLGGQTLGKRVFGIRVREGGPLRPAPSFMRAIARYLVSFGAIVVLAELPPTLFRATAFSGPLWLVELHMFFALWWSFVLAATAIADSQHRGIHDRIADTLVLRPGALGITAPLDQSRVRYRLWGSFAAATAIALLLWVPGISIPEPARSLQAHRYSIESELPLLLASFELQGETLKLQMVLTGTSSTEELEQYADWLDRFIPRQRPLGVNRIEYEFYPNPVDSGTTTARTVARSVS